jgi:hypothetical protein
VLDEAYASDAAPAGPAAADDVEVEGTEVSLSVCDAMELLTWDGIVVGMLAVLCSEVGFGRARLRGSMANVSPLALTYVHLTGEVGVYVGVGVGVGVDVDRRKTAKEIVVSAQAA